MEILSSIVFNLLCPLVLLALVAGGWLAQRLIFSSIDIVEFALLTILRSWSTVFDLFVLVVTNVFFPNHVSSLPSSTPSSGPSSEPSSDGSSRRPIVKGKSVTFDLENQKMEKQDKPLFKPIQESRVSFALSSTPSSKPSLSRAPSSGHSSEPSSDGSSRWPIVNGKSVTFDMKCLEDEKSFPTTQPVSEQKQNKPLFKPIRESGVSFASSSTPSGKPGLSRAPSSGPSSEPSSDGSSRRPIVNGKSVTFDT
jgi:hypothetical protein